MTNSNLAERAKSTLQSGYKLESLPRSCLILSPFSERFNNIYPHLMAGAENAGFVSTTLYQPGEMPTMIDDVRQLIESSDAVIVDTTGNNPNVMYELGFAHALKKPVMLIVREDEFTVPADLQGHLFYIYKENNLPELSMNIERWLKRIRDEREKK